MRQGIQTVIISVAATAMVGSVFGVLVGALIDEYLIAIGIGVFLGAIFGMAIGYGLLPESEADQPAEEQGEA